MASRVTQDQQAEGIIFLSAPVSGEIAAFSQIDRSGQGARTDGLSGGQNRSTCDTKLEKVTAIYFSFHFCPPLC